MRWFTLALRNLFRNPRRTIITLAAIAFGLTLVHAMIGLQTGSYADMIRQGVGTLAGHVVVQAKGYQVEKDGDLVVADVGAIGAQIGSRFPDATVAPRLFLGGLLTSTTGSVGAAVNGVDPIAEAAVQDIDEKIVSGTWLDADDRGIVIGTKMADTLGVAVGDKVVYMGQHGESTEVQSRMFRIKGIFRTGGAEIDGFVAFANLSAAQAIFGTPDIANQITLHLDDVRGAEAATALIAGDLSGRDVDVLSWKDALPEIYGLIQLDRASGDVMLSILGVIVAMGVLNTMLMSVLERTKEFGVMLAVGLPPMRLSALILTEGALIGLVGGALGLAGGMLLSWPMITWGVDYSSFLGGDTFESGGVALSSVLKARLNPMRSAAYTIGAVVFTTLAALYPAIHVARLRPVDAMHDA